MPIRFRCAYCHQLMGIARRKAGAIVSCPTCSGKVVVPQPPDELPATARPGERKPNVFEGKDFDAGFMQPVPDAMPTRAAGAHPPTMPSPPDGEFDVQPVALPDALADSLWPAPPGAATSRIKIVLLIVVMLLLAASAFAAGFAAAKLTG